MLSNLTDLLLRMPESPTADPERIIGIISGMGPYAGLDLAAKIHRFTDARTDQEHCSVALLSYPGRLADRSAFLLDPGQSSPVPALTEIARQLEAAGAMVAGMPCNTAHGPAIFDAMKEGLRQSGHAIQLVHMIEEMARHIRRAWPQVERVGVLSSLAVYELGLYKDVLEAAGLDAVRPPRALQEGVVSPVIWDTAYGIKAQSDPVTPRAREDLLTAVRHLHGEGAEAVILGCTEFPLAIPEAAVDGLPMIDPTAVLARALIRAAHPEKLLEEERVASGE